MGEIVRLYSGFKSLDLKMSTSVFSTKYLFPSLEKYFESYQVPKGKFNRTIW